MKKWILPVCTLVLALGLGNAVDGNAMTTQEKLQKQAEEQALYEAYSGKTMTLMEDADTNLPGTGRDAAIPASGTLPCENGNTISYTLENGVLTISGSGDELTSEYASYFSYNDDITKVIFTNDCMMTNMPRMFYHDINLTTVENIPQTVTRLDSTFAFTGLTSYQRCRQI